MQQPLAAGQALAGYQLRRVIGRGEQSTVYLAAHAGTGQVVALKVMPLHPGAHPAPGAAFLKAAEVARQLVHPGIVAVLAAGLGPGFAWVAMEAVPGSDLARYTTSARLLPEPLVLRLALRVTQALGHAHQQGVVHRDLKPANVLVDWPTDTVKLADFGLARFDGAAQTGTGIVLGTPAYMAPEQLAGNVPTPAGDLYALGVLLFQLLSGRLPHDATSMGELLRQVSSQQAPDLRSVAPAVPAGLAALVARLLAKKPAGRPANAATVAAALAALLAAAPGLP